MAEQLLNQELLDDVTKDGIDSTEAEKLAGIFNTADRKSEKKDINDVLSYNNNIDNLLSSLKNGVNKQIQEADKLIKDIGDTNNIEEDKKWEDCNKNLGHYRAIYAYLKNNVIANDPTKVEQINRVLQNIFGTTLVLDDGPDLRRQKNKAAADREAADREAVAEIKAAEEKRAADKAAADEKRAADEKKIAEEKRKIEKPTMDEVNKKILEAKEPLTPYDFNSIIQYSADNAQIDVNARAGQDLLTPFIAYSQIAKLNFYEAAYEGFFQNKEILYNKNAESDIQINSLSLNDRELYNINKIDTPQSASILSLVMVANANPENSISKKILRGCPLVEKHLGDPAVYNYEIDKNEVNVFLTKYENQFKNVYNSLPNPNTGKYENTNTILNMEMLFTPAKIPS